MLAILLITFAWLPIVLGLGFLYWHSEYRHAMKHTEYKHGCMYCAGRELDRHRMYKNSI